MPTKPPIDIDLNLSEQERYQMLVGLRAQMESSLQQVLPPQAYASYMKRRHRWMAVFPAPASKASP